MPQQTRHLATRIDRPADEVYLYVSDPRNLPEWAAGLAGSIELVDGRWGTDTPAGRVTVTFAPPNAFGVVDHDVTLPSGQTIHVPMRVISDGDGCDVVFTVRRQPGMSDADFDRDADAVATDLATLSRLLGRR